MSSVFCCLPWHSSKFDSFVYVNVRFLMFYCCTVSDLNNSFRALFFKNNCFQNSVFYYSLFKTDSSCPIFLCLINSSEASYQEKKDNLEKRKSIPLSLFTWKLLFKCRKMSYIQGASDRLCSDRAWTIQNITDFAAEMNVWNCVLVCPGPKWEFSELNSII